MTRLLHVTHLNSRTRFEFRWAWKWSPCCLLATSRLTVLLTQSMIQVLKCCVTVFSFPATSVNIEIELGLFCVTSHSVPHLLHPWWWLIDLILLFPGIWNRVYKIISANFSCKIWRLGGSFMQPDVRAVWRDREVGQTHQTERNRASWFAAPHSYHGQATFLSTGSMRPCCVCSCGNPSSQFSIAQGDRCSV